MTRYEEYRERMPNISEANKSSFDDLWKEVHDWYESDIGKRLFIDMFRHETGINVNLGSDQNFRIENALAKSWGDYAKKAQRDAYYKSHAEMFLIEMDSILSRVPRSCDRCDSNFRFANVFRFVEKVLLDHRVLLEDWGRRKAKVPLAFGVVKNPLTDPLSFYHGAKQIIYGHGSFDLTIADNHSELAIATVRQAVEVRLRNAFGLIGKEPSQNGTFHPVPLSVLLEVLSSYKDQIQTPIPMQNLARINKWANLSLHSGFREYSWTVPYVLNYLRELLVGNDFAAGSFSVDSGIRLPKSTFDAIRNDLRKKIERARDGNSSRMYKAILSDEKNCSVVFV